MNATVVPSSKLLFHRPASNIVRQSRRLLSTRVTSAPSTPLLDLEAEKLRTGLKVPSRTRLPFSRSHYPAPAKHLATMTQRRVPIDAQSVDAPLTSSATFLVLAVNKSKSDSISTVRSALSGVSDIAKNVSIRDLNAQFACTVGIGSNYWDEITGKPCPKELHPFKEMKGETHTAPSTPGDLLFHIRSERRDLNFEFERQLMDQLGDSVSVVDETVGFRYFDVRDLLGFVDGTANPVGPAVPECTLVTMEDDENVVGGSYVVIQKYLHDLKGWKALPTDTQEAIVGRTKLENVELDDAPEGKQQAHKSLATVVDEQGNEHDILRDNMPFGSPAEGQFGTYFIGYSRRLWVTEKMLERMFIGDPPGMHDRILNFSTAVTAQDLISWSDKDLIGKVFSCPWETIRRTGKMILG